MSREIKFRAWNENTKHLFEITAISLDKHKVSMGFVGYDRYGKLVEFPVMQYTGLKDKNGVEIYEGDRWKDCNGVLSVIEWDATDACFFMNGTDGHEDMMDNIGGGEVIGNIYEHRDMVDE